MTDLVPVGRHSAHLQKKIEAGLKGWLEHVDDHTYKRALEHFAQWLGQGGDTDGSIDGAGKLLIELGAAKSNALVEAFLRDILYELPEEQRIARATAQKRLAVIRSALRDMRKLGIIDWTLEVTLPRPKKDKYGRLVEKSGRDMRGPSITEAKKILEAAKEDPDPRALFLLSALRFEGYREHELRQLDLKDLDITRKQVRMVRKKRDKPDWFPLSTETTKAAKRWIDARGKKHGPLLTGGEHGCDTSKRIGSTTIYDIVRRICDTAGVPNMSPHKIRHRACTDIVRACTEASLPQEEMLRLTGHSNRAAIEPYFEFGRVRSSRRVLDTIGEYEDESDDV